VNSEELELSLRSEFENYLKSFRAEIRQEATELQKRLDEAFQAYAARFDSEQELDEAFSSTVTEHLRLSRDEGARLAAEAMAEAEQIERDSGAAADYSSIRDAVADISSQQSQSAILKSLVTQAAAFAPRGAFFIIKSENFVGWDAFGDDGSAESKVHDIHFSASADTILGRSIGSMSSVDSAYGAHQEDHKFLDTLQFGQPDRMYAIPLVARGRGVAVLYADHGDQGRPVNVEALETLVRIAALTVELQAALHTAHAEGRETAAADFEHAQTEPTGATPAFDESAAWKYETPSATYEQPAGDFAFSETEPAAVYEAEPAPSYEADPAVSYDQHAVSTETEHQIEPEPEFEAQPAGEVPSFEPAVEEYPTEPEVVASPFETTPQPEPAGVGVAEGVMPERSIAVSPHARARLSDRPVDLPIDVAEEERRLHNDARRFARLLVSEIKLYNEKKVQEGRQANDLYDRLREAIDRSREMYDKRVQPPVASKFDYFHYELVNALADGNAERLGSSYPGSTV
jgi:hypothetical protein